MGPTETIYEGEHYMIPHSEMGSWLAYIKDLSIFSRDGGNLEIAFSDKFSKYKVSLTKRCMFETDSILVGDDKCKNCGKKFKDH